VNAANPILKIILILQEARMNPKISIFATAQRPQNWVNLVLSKATHVISKRNIKTESIGNFSFK